MDLPPARKETMVKNLYDRFDESNKGILEEEEIVKFLTEYLQEARNLHVYLYGEPFGRRLAKEIPIEQRLSGISYDVWSKQFEDDQETFLRACVDVLDPYPSTSVEASSDTYITKQNFLKNTREQFLNKPKLADEDECNEIVPNLFLGSVKCACDKEVLDRNGITHIVNIGLNLAKPHEEHFTYLYLGDVLDTPDQLLFPYMERCHRFMDKAIIEEGGKVFVHCQLGVSRSATIVLSFLMRMNQWDLWSAYTYVKSRRPFVDPNIGFQTQLIEFHAKEYSYDPEMYAKFDKDDKILQRMDWGLQNVEEITLECEDDNFERVDEMRFFTLLFASSQEMLVQTKAMKDVQKKAVSKLRFFQTEFVQSQSSLASFDRMFKSDGGDEHARLSQIFEEPL